MRGKIVAKVIALNERARRAIAVHACGFRYTNELCYTAQNRLILAKSEAEKNDIKDIIISGGVPYQKGSPLLAHLMGHFIDQNRFRLHYAVDCYNSSTDIQNILEIAEKQGFTSILAISSTWHLWALKPLYRHWQKEMDYRGNIYFAHPDLDPAGCKTILFYIIYSLLLRISLAFGFFNLFDNFINKIHAKRINGYPVSGCN